MTVALLRLGIWQTSERASTRVATARALSFSLFIRPTIQRTTYSAAAAAAAAAAVLRQRDDTILSLTVSSSARSLARPPSAETPTIDHGRERSTRARTLNRP